VTEDALEQTIRSLPAKGFTGANVTLPYKVSVMQFAHHITGSRDADCAANTLIFKEDGRIL
jgi:shikimate dehydrogenase